MKPRHIGDQLWIEALQYFGCEEKASRWLQSPNLALGGVQPIEYCASHDNGTQVVRELIIRLKYGMTS